MASFFNLMHCILFEGNTHREIASSYYSFSCVNLITSRNKIDLYYCETSHKKIQILKKKSKKCWLKNSQNVMLIND